MRPIQSMRVAAVILVAFTVLGLAATAGARTITGTPRNDRLVGTPRADVIRGLAGRDVLLGRGGADYLHGGGKADTMDGGPGADRIQAAYDGSRDGVRCGAGTDLVNADLVDSVARDCELVGRKLAEDPYPADGGQHESLVEPDSFTYGRTTVATFQVGRRFEGAATNIGFAVTTDDGATWRSGFLPGLTRASVPPGVNERASDPAVAFDARHGQWLISTLALGAGVTRLAINRSADGFVWSTALNAAEETAGGAEGIAFDKNWIACDNTPTSPFYGRCYLLYTHSAAADILAVRWSDDGGLTWSPESSLGVRPAVGIFPAIRPNGDLVAVYLFEAGGFSIAASRSTDGGVTWAPSVRIAGVTNGCAIRDFRAFPLPSAAVDAGGRVWATWHDCQSQTVRRNAVFVATSVDGAAWSAPTTVTRGADDVLPAVGTDPATGRVAIAFLRKSPVGIDTFVLESAGSPTRWGAARRLSVDTSVLSAMPRTSSGYMLGDYISVHYASGRPLVVWVLALQPLEGALRQAVYATRA